ncbi:MAG TPA: hypothetical protein EYN79_07170 [Planctomycetes bacterium]|nr:hypothetical protein [Planctomycetota bacterium]
MARSSFDVSGIIAPLWAIFWGGLFCWIDYGIFYNTPAIAINIEDVFNDLLGMTSLTWGIFRLRRINIDDYNWKMVVVSIVAGTLWLQTLFFTFGVLIPSGWVAAVVNPILNLAQLTALLLLCMAMTHLCEVARLHASVKWWQLLSFIALFFSLAPFSILLLLSLLASVSIISSDIVQAILDFLGTPMVVLASLFVLLFLFSTLITRNEARKFIARPAAEGEGDEYTYFFDEEEEQEG